ncbi:hypothetical protein L2E82_33698 [Cichorium intybus]|uniref:Uncharacterized protein n=1 Tax=Cichorium intybus TaxID=13427 RepID=A0ACB9BKV4_CICIN|nr:hypothetical protein L2E82_33698 [Cichorium intybus]
MVQFTRSLLGNSVGGPIPREIGDIATLEELLLSANNFTGNVWQSDSIPVTNLEDLIDGSTLSGRIPSFIRNWTRLIRLDWQGTSMEGPIPSIIYLLRNLEELTKYKLPQSAKFDTDG